MNRKDGHYSFAAEKTCKNVFWYNPDVEDRIFDSFRVLRRGRGRALIFASAVPNTEKALGPSHTMRQRVIFEQRVSGEARFWLAAPYADLVRRCKFSSLVLLRVRITWRSKRGWSFFFLSFFFFFAHARIGQSEMREEGTQRPESFRRSCEKNSLVSMRSSCIDSCRSWGRPPWYGHHKSHCDQADLRGALSSCSSTTAPMPVANKAKVSSVSPDMIHSGWLGKKHQLTN